MLGASTYLMALATVAPSPAGIQDKSQPNPVDAVVECRALVDSTERLACFDRASAALATAREKKDVVVLDRAEVQKTRRSLFGFSLPRIRLFGGDDDDRRVNPEDVNEITGTVASVSQTAADRWTVTLDDQSRWITTDTARGFPPRRGEAVTIRRGPLGSYDASFAKRRSIKVRRTQ
jgi:hypothetical protein